MVNYFHLFLIPWIVIIHYIADFLLQTNWQAQNKSKDIIPLLDHTFFYSITIVVLSFPYVYEVKSVIYLFVITFLCHTITDYFTSRWSTKYFSKGKTREGFRVVGFDQLLHYLQLFLTFFFILK